MHTVGSAKVIAMRKLIFTFYLSCAFVMAWANNNVLFAVGPSDTVTITPEKPTTDDSLIFRAYNADHCCCTQYRNKLVTVNDSSIILSSAVNEKNCKTCFCFAAGSYTEFSCGPIESGTYKIFKSEEIYCPPGQLCPAIAIPVRLIQIGEVTVRAAFPVNQSTASKIARQRSSHSVLFYSSAEKKIILKLAKAQFVLVTAYIVNGEQSKELSSRKFLPAGTHSFKMDLQRFKSGVVIIHVKGENFSEVRMINLAK